MGMKKVYSVFLLLLLCTALFGAAYAAFSGRSRILGTSVSVGSADIRLLADVSGGLAESNLVTEKSGPVLSGIYPNWASDYLVKLYNNSPGTLSIRTNANYATDQDPAELRQLLFVQFFPWDDSNSNGLVDTGELGSPLERKTIVKWKTEGFDLGTIESGQVMGYVLRFSTDSISDTKQGASGIFDFEFNSLGL